jgi:hypothetical protein
LRSRDRKNILKNTVIALILIVRYEVSGFREQAAGRREWELWIMKWEE